MSIEKQKYIFPNSYEKQLKSALQNGALAFDFYSDKSNVEIIISSALLPKHCELKLIENALVNLEKFPDNTALLNALGKYTKNNLFERLGYLGMLGGTVGIGLTGIALFAIPAFSVVLPTTIAFFGLSIMVAASIFFIFNKYVCQGYLGLQLGRWISDFVKGSKGTEQALIKELEGNLNALIKSDETKEIVKETVAEPGLVSQYSVNDSRDDVLQRSEESHDRSSPFCAGGWDFSYYYYPFFENKDKLDDHSENSNMDINDTYYRSA